MLRFLFLFTFSILLFCCNSVMAQSQQTDQSSDQLFKENPFDRGATYGNAESSSKQSNKKKKKRNKGYGIDYEQKEKEYEERMKKVARKYKKMEKEMKKPQYSDPTYFGHKKKPKKRKPGKKKFCEECGMKH